MRDNLPNLVAGLTGSKAQQNPQKQRRGREEILHSGINFVVFSTEIFFPRCRHRLSQPLVIISI